MRVSNNWLKELVDVDDTALNIANSMLHAGNEYESINFMCPCTNLVIGKIVSVKDHPDSDHLHVCEVDLGDKIYQIVCGATNLKEGIKVIVSKVGATLPGGVIKASVIRGVESNGMICALSELGIESKYIKETGKCIHILPDNAPVGMDAIEYLNYNDSYVDYELTANRSDLLSMIGMAYEVGAIYDKDVKKPSFKINENKEKTSSLIKVENKTDKCSAYKGRIVKDVTISESPEFIKARLMAAGIRPINNVVDISNYVMIEYGQPLHFFDLDKLENSIEIREAKELEKMVTLDGVERTLKSTDIVITSNDKIVALAGVMGGENSEVTENTKNIFIESAIFDSLSIRKTSKEILRSEASIRFEKGIDPNINEEALNRAAYLLGEYANGTILEGIVGFNKNDLNSKEISITLEKINKVLGMHITCDEVKSIFKRLGFSVKEVNDNFIVNVPTRRLDINIKEDLIEEIGRMHGYDNMEGTLPVSKIKQGKYLPKNKYIKNIKNRLSSLGLDEVITYSLVNKDEIELFKDKEFTPIKVLSPLTEDKCYVRYSLVPSLLKVYDYNSSRNIKDLCMYEISKVYYDDYIEENKLCILMTGLYVNNDWKEKNKIDFYTIKGVLENLFDYLGVGSRYNLLVEEIKDYHPGMSAKILIDKEIVGYIGRVHPSVNKNDIFVCELNVDKLFNTQIGKIKFKEISKYPSVVKDVAFILDNDINSIDIINTIIKKGGKIVKDATVFDVFKDIEPNKKSLAFKITFQDPSKTLTDEEVIESFNKIIKMIEKEYNAVLRNK